VKAFIAEITGCAARDLMFAVMETCCLGTWLMRPRLRERKKLFLKLLFS